MSAKNEFLQKRVQKFSWDASVDGALVKNASTSLGTLPANSVITGGFIDVVTALHDADAGDNTTVAIGVTGSTSAFLAAAAVSTYTLALKKAILPGVVALDGNALTAANAQTAIGTALLDNASEVEVLLTVNNDQNVTVGKLNIFVEYVISA